MINIVYTSTWMHNSHWVWYKPISLMLTICLPSARFMLHIYLLTLLTKQGSTPISMLSSLREGWAITDLTNATLPFVITAYPALSMCIVLVPNSNHNFLSEQFFIVLAVFFTYYMLYLYWIFTMDIF